MHKYKAFVEVHETYQKRSIRNRAELASANGRLDISVPLKKGKTQLPIGEVLISYDEPWAIHHLKVIKSAYGSAPYFDYYYPKVEKLLQLQYDKLLDLNMEVLRFFQELGYSPEVHTSQSYVTQEQVADNGKWVDKRSFDSVGYEGLPAYNQVFEAKYGFLSGLSALDLLFNVGPEGAAYLKRS